MNKHAPGPWTNHGRIPQPGLPHSTVAAKTLIARVYSEAFGDIEQEEANARLMSAAPELLEALQMYVESMRDAFPDFGHFESPAYKATVSAIFKATGEKIDYEPEQQDHVHAELKTHIVNGVEIPDLRVVPEHGDSYYLVDPTVPELTSLYRFTGTVIDKIWVGRCLAYQPTEEGKQAAILHAKAMLGIAMGCYTMTETGEGKNVSAEDLEALQAHCGTLAEALVWYSEQVSGCRKVTSEGERSRAALDRDGGARARAALAAHRKLGGLR